MYIFRFRLRLTFAKNDSSFCTGRDGCRRLLYYSCLSHFILSSLAKKKSGINVVGMNKRDLIEMLWKHDREKGLTLRTFMEAQTISNHRIVAQMLKKKKNFELEYS